MNGPANEQVYQVAEAVLMAKLWNFGLTAKLLLTGIVAWRGAKALGCSLLIVAWRGAKALGCSLLGAFFFAGGLEFGVLKHGKLPS